MLLPGRISPDPKSKAGPQGLGHGAGRLEVGSGDLLLWSSESGVGFETRLIGYSHLK